MEASKKAVLKAFPKGSFTRDDARQLMAKFPQLKMENDQSTHFQLTLRDNDGHLIWRCWNFESAGGEELKSNLK